MIMDQFIPPSLLHFHSKILPRLSPFFTSFSLSPSLILRKKLLFASFALAFFYPVFWRWIPKCIREEPVRWRLTELQNAVRRGASSLFKKQNTLLLFNIFSFYLICFFPFFLTLVRIKARFNKKGEKFATLSYNYDYFLSSLLHIFSNSFVDSQVHESTEDWNDRKEASLHSWKVYSIRNDAGYRVTDRREKNQKSILMECLLFTFSIFETWTEMLNSNTTMPFVKKET